MALVKGLYAAFDVFPSAKGAATHIAAVAPLLFSHTNGGILFVLGAEGLPTYQEEEGIEIVRFNKGISNYLERGMAFSTQLRTLLQERMDQIGLAQFRDPWSGIAIVDRDDRPFRAIYEINGLPSIELPSIYPSLSPGTLAKIRAMEERCWARADHIIVPSATIADNLARLGLGTSKIELIPNGADIPPPFPRPVDAPSRYILYFGALQRWQGIDVLLRAMTYLSDCDDLHLVICASTKHRYAKAYRKMAERLGLADRLLWRYGLHKRELGGWIQGSELTVAPLTECARNIEQGCAPLKILESMAAGIPVVASDLPAIREIMADGEHGRLVRAERPSDLARAIRLLLADDAGRRRMGKQGRERIQAALTWRSSLDRLQRMYSYLSAPTEFRALSTPYSHGDIDTKTDHADHRTTGVHRLEDDRHGVDG